MVHKCYMAQVLHGAHVAFSICWHQGVSGSGTSGIFLRTVAMATPNAVASDITDSIVGAQPPLTQP